MKHVWTVLCQKSAIDVENNLLSLFNCIEEFELILDKVPTTQTNLVIPVEFQLVSFWTVEDSSIENILETRGELIDPAGKVLSKFENKFAIKKGALRFRNRTNIQGLAITEAGGYFVRLSYKKAGEANFEIVSELPLDVKIAYKIMDKPIK